MKESASTVAIALGANLGDRLSSLRSAVAAIHQLPGTSVASVSSVWETAPVGYQDQPDFLNAAVLTVTQLSPHQLMSALQQIEARHLRVREIPNGPRTLDLDLLFYDQIVHQESELIIPHPRLHERLFVLAPLAEVAPDWCHPLLGVSVIELYQQLQNQEGIIRCSETLDEN